MNKKEPEIFAKGLCFKKYFFFFVIGSIFGCYYEMILNLISHFMGGDPWFWETRSGVIYGPFSVIYGLGVIIMIWCLAEKGLKWWQIFIYGALLGAACEYIVGFLQETFTGTMSWNYSDHFLNLHGRTSFFVACVWGLICLILIKYVYPFISRQIERIPVKIGNIIFYSLLVFLIIDIFISFSAVIRMNLRHHEVPTFTPYGQFLDSVYPDERVHRAYPNMVDLPNN